MTLARAFRKKGNCMKNKKRKTYVQKINNQKEEKKAQTTFTFHY